ncbi:thiamine pyrophosphate-binding protein [Streptomyces olivaceoviridis]
MTLMADYVPRRLREWGIERVYSHPGDGINGLLGAFDRAKGEPEFIRTRHEESAPERAGIAAEGVRQKLTEYAEHLPGRHA